MTELTRLSSLHSVPFYCAYWQLQLVNKVLDSIHSTGCSSGTLQHTSGHYFSLWMCTMQNMEENGSYVVPITSHGSSVSSTSLVVFVLCGLAHLTLSECISEGKIMIQHG